MKSTNTFDTFVPHITIVMVNQDADSGPRFIPSAAYKDHAQLRFGCQVLNNHNNGDDDDGDDDPPYCLGCQEIQFLL